MKRCAVFAVSAVLLFMASASFAESKVWGGGGDGTTWADDDNWFAAGAPDLSDDITIDSENAAVTCAANFFVKSITLGGREAVTLTTGNFIYGAIEPDTSSGIGILNRPGGKLILKGSSGTITVKGQYKDSEEALADEPSFIFWLE